MKVKLGLFALSLACAAAAHAQAIAGFGAVAGTIRDPYGDGLPDTSVVISNDTLGVTRTLMTTDDGMFLAPSLPPGTGYQIKASRQGYGTWEYKDFDVTVGATVNFGVTLQAETETTTIADGAVFSAAVEDNKFNVSSFVSRRQLENLPQRARRLDDTILLAPGVTQDPATGVIAFRGEGGTNAVYSDGNYTQNTWFYERPNIAPQWTPDSVREFQVIPAGATSEFGHAFGGTVNAVTPTGGEDFHGNLYAFYSNHSWNALDRFAGLNPAQRWEQGGGSLGGPIEAGKLYFFANVEAWKGRSQGLNELSSPLLAGPFGTSLASNCKASPAQCAAAISFLSPQVDTVIQRSMTDYAGVARIDYRRSDKNNITLEANALHGRAPNGSNSAAIAPYGGLLGANGNFGEDTRFAKVDWTVTLGGTIANELRAGWFKDRVSNSINPALQPSTGNLAIDIAGSSVGANPQFPQTVSENRYELVDNFSWASLSHLLKFGGDISLNTDWTNQLFNRYGNFIYPSLTAFASDLVNPGTARNYSLFSQSFNNPIGTIHTRVYSAYAQDGWRASRRLNVMFGVRWEKYHVPQPQYANTTYYQTGSIGSPSNAFAPRVGVNYLLNDKTVVRLGIDFYYQPYTGELLHDLLAGNAIYQTTISVTPNQSGAPVFPKVIASSNTTPNGTQNILYANSKIKLPYAEVGTFAIERRLTRDTVLTLSYIESRGTKLWTVTDLNLAPSTVTKTYAIDDINGAAVGSFTSPMWNARSDNGHAHVFEIFNEGFSRYRGGTLQLRKALTHGITAQVSYTYSHAFDDVSGPPAIGFIPATTVPGDYRGDEGNSNFDQRHRAVLNWIWAPNPVKDDSGAAKFLLNGWQISGTATFATGLPETPVVIVNGQQFSGLTMLYPTSLNGSGGWSRVPLQGVNRMYTENQYVVNARVTRMLPFSDRVKGMLMFEAFNALNRQYATTLDTIAYVATSGVLHPVPGVGTGIAGNGYPFGSNARYAQVAFRLQF